VKPWFFRCECGVTGGESLIEEFARRAGVKHQETHHPGSAQTRDTFEVNQQS
jgi:hypothetical protein